MRYVLKSSLTTVLDNNGRQRIIKMAWAIWDTETDELHSDYTSIKAAHRALRALND